jgi:hypothetical protein
MEDSATEAEAGPRRFDERGERQRRMRNVVRPVVFGGHGPNDVLDRSGAKNPGTYWTGRPGSNPAEEIRTCLTLDINQQALSHLIATQGHKKSGHYRPRTDGAGPPVGSDRTVFTLRR